MGTIHDKAPRETIGRDTASRFRMQYQAAAYAALEILSGKDVDRVYCDYQDDFVVRRTSKGVVEYHFFQVKTKGGRGNQQWSVGEVFSLKKKGKLDTEEELGPVRNSIAGKLFLHTVEYREQCREITILSNVHFDNDVYEVNADLAAGTSDKKYIQQFIAKFSEVIRPKTPLTPAELEAARKKLTLHPNVQYIGETLEAFTVAASHAIWKHSEIDLQKHEMEEIAKSLVSLVGAKSCEPIASQSKDAIDLITGVGLEDLLNVLSISTQVYNNLLAGQDSLAIKTASILQRTLEAAGASQPMIELASQEKVAWDVWVRTARHTYPDFKLNLLLEEIDSKCQDWLLAGGKTSHLDSFVITLSSTPLAKYFQTLTEDLIFGGFCAAIVRRATR